MFFYQYRCNTKSLYFADILSSSQTSILKYRPINYQFNADWWDINILLNTGNPPVVPWFRVSTPEGRLNIENPFSERLPTLRVRL